jgi:hypothetical protein
MRKLPSWWSCWLMGDSGGVVALFAEVDRVLVREFCFRKQSESFLLVGCRDGFAGVLESSGELVEERFFYSCLCCRGFGSARSDGANRFFMSG